MALAPTPNIVVLVSGNGSNLQALLDAEDRLGGSIVGVVANRADAGGLTRAERAGVATAVVAAQPGEERRAYDARLADTVARFRPHLIVLAGWMRLLTGEFLDRFPGAVINLHPALPGDYPGLDAIARAYDDARDGLRDHTGVMVHFVPDEGVDDGPVIATATVPIGPDDTLDDVTANVHRAEHRLLTDTVRTLCAQLIPSEQ